MKNKKTVDDLFSKYMEARQRLVELVEAENLVHRLTCEQAHLGKQIELPEAAVTEVYDLACKAEEDFIVAHDAYYKAENNTKPKLTLAPKENN